MQEGILLKREGRLFPYEMYEGGVYGYNNRYGAVYRIAAGGASPTKAGADPGKGIIELRIVGLSVAPRDLMDMYTNKIQFLYDEISEKDYENVLNKIKQEREDMKGINPMRKYNGSEGLFECLSREEMAKVLCDLREMPERQLSGPVSDRLRILLNRESVSRIFPDRKEE